MTEGREAVGIDTNRVAAMTGTVTDIRNGGVAVRPRADDGLAAVARFRRNRCRVMTGRLGFA